MINTQECPIVESLYDYLLIINRLKESYPLDIFGQNPTKIQFLYRGHSDSAYEMLPSLFRQSKDDVTGELCDRYQWNSELTILQMFIHEASTTIKIDPTNYLNWAEYAQHYGVPTRFLDFTLNPLVALYFACKGNPEKDGKVWVFHPRNYRAFYAEREHSLSSEVERKTLKMMFEESIKGESKRQLPVHYTPYYVDERMKAQKSYFLVWGEDRKPLEDLLEGDQYRMLLPEEKHHFATYGVEQQQAVLFSITIPKHKKAILLREADTVGINQMTLFPGLDGIGKYIEWQNRYSFRETFSHLGIKEE